MTGSRSTTQQSNCRGRKHQFLVHLLKITRLPSHTSSSIVDGSPHKSARRDALKVIALFNSQQVALGDFPVSINECVIDRKLTCQFTISKSGAHSKLHLYIDQTYSSGLAGHLALDLQEFIREDEEEIYLKYPLYANTSRHSRGPVLKILVQNLAKRDAETTIAEDNEIVLHPCPGIEKLHGSSISAAEEPGCISQELTSSSQLESERDQRCHLDEEASFLQLEGALSDIGEKLKALVSSFKTRENCQNGDYLVPDMESQSSITSPLLSSLHTGTSLDSHSEIYEEQCTDWDDVLDASFDLGSSTDHPQSFAKYARTWSDMSARTRNLRYPQVLKSDRNASTESSSESCCKQASTRHGDRKDHSPDECFMCSSAHVLQSYEGLQASLSSRSKSFSACSTSLVLRDRDLALAELPSPLRGQQHSDENNAAEASVSRKRPGLLKSLFGAVVVAGVSLLGARSSNMSRNRVQPRGSQSSQSKRPGRNVRASFSYDTRNDRSVRNGYSFRR